MYIVVWRKILSLTTTTQFDDILIFVIDHKLPYDKVKVGILHSLSTFYVLIINLSYPV